MRVSTNLHLLAGQQYGKNDVIKRTTHLLLEYGAQLDRTNSYGNTGADVWIRRHKPEDGWKGLPKWCLKPVTVPNLKSLCARDAFFPISWCQKYRNIKKYSADVANLIIKLAAGVTQPVEKMHINSMVYKSFSHVNLSNSISQYKTR